MNQTKQMKADDICVAFNSVADRVYWKASLAGTRINPTVRFNSRASMVRVTYDVTSGEFSIDYERTACAWGDFLASAYRSLAQITNALKAGGMAFSTPMADTARLRIEYDPVRKLSTVSIAGHGDEWQAAEPMAFKVPERAT